MATSRYSSSSSSNKAVFNAMIALALFSFVLVYLCTIGKVTMSGINHNIAQLNQYQYDRRIHVNSNSWKERRSRNFISSGQDQDNDVMNENRKGKGHRVGRVKFVTRKALRKKVTLPSMEMSTLIAGLEIDRAKTYDSVKYQSEVGVAPEPVPAPATSELQGTAKRRRRIHSPETQKLGYDRSTANADFPNHEDKAMPPPDHDFQDENTGPKDSEVRREKLSVTQDPIVMMNLNESSIGGLSRMKSTVPVITSIDSPESAAVVTPPNLKEEDPDVQHSTKTVVPYQRKFNYTTKGAVGASTSSNTAYLSLELPENFSFSSNRRMSTIYKTTTTTEKPFNIFDANLSAKLVEFFKTAKAKSIMVLGRGMSQYVEALKSIAEITCNNGAIKDGTAGDCQLDELEDLKEGVELAPHDWVLFFGLQDSIPPKFHKQFLKYIASGSQSGIVIRWYPKKFKGRMSSHLNKDSGRYVKNVLKELGFKYVVAAAKQFKDPNDPTLSDLNQSVMVFQRGASS